MAATATAAAGQIKSIKEIIASYKKKEWKGKKEIASRQTIMALQLGKYTAQQSRLKVRTGLERGFWTFSTQETHHIFCFQAHNNR